MLFLLQVCYSTSKKPAKLFLMRKITSYENQREAFGKEFVKRMSKIGLVFSIQINASIRTQGSTVLSVLSTALIPQNITFSSINKLSKTIKQRLVIDCMLKVTKNS